MTMLLLYALGVLIMVGLAAIVVLSFVRYRFKGDLTFIFIGVFIIAFIITITLTLSFLDVTSLT